MRNLDGVEGIHRGLSQNLLTGAEGNR